MNERKKEKKKMNEIKRQNERNKDQKKRMNERKKNDGKKGEKKQRKEKRKSRLLRGISDVSQRPIDVNKIAKKPPRRFLRLNSVLTLGQQGRHAGTDGTAIQKTWDTLSLFTIPDRRP